MQPGLQPSQQPVPNNPAAAHFAQEELSTSKEQFRDKFGDTPRKDDLTVLVPRQDDPTEQVGHWEAWLGLYAWQPAAP